MYITVFPPPRITASNIQPPDSLLIGITHRGDFVGGFKDSTGSIKDVSSARRPDVKVYNLIFLSPNSCSMQPSNFNIFLQGSLKLGLD